MENWPHQPHPSLAPLDNFPYNSPDSVAKRVFQGQEEGGGNFGLKEPVLVADIP
jgi:hypothetical protein